MHSDAAVARPMDSCGRARTADDADPDRRVYVQAFTPAVVGDERSALFGVHASQPNWIAVRAEGGVCSPCNAGDRGDGRTETCDEQCTPRTRRLSVNGH